MLHGIDVSNYQGNVDWAHYAKSGIAFGIAKATEGTTFRDSRFPHNWSGMHAHDLVRGAYHFAHPRNDPEHEAKYFLDYVRAHGLHDGDLLALDLESNDGKSAAHVAAYARAWCSYVHKHANCKPIVYTYISFARGGYCSGLGEYPLWIAAPSSKAGHPPVPVGPWKSWQIHQYADKPVDKDLYHGTSKHELRALGVGGQEEEVPIRTSLGHTKDQSLRWGEFTVIDWDTEYEDHHGAHVGGDNPGYVAPYSSWADFHASIRVDGLDAGDSWQLEYQVHDWKDGKSSGDPWAEVDADFPATSGSQYVTGTCSKGLTKGQHCYVAIKVNPKGGDAGGRPAPKAVHGRWTIAQDKS